MEGGCWCRRSAELLGGEAGGECHFERKRGNSELDVCGLRKFWWVRIGIVVIVRRNWMEIDGGVAVFEDGAFSGTSSDVIAASRFGR